MPCLEIRVASEKFPFLIGTVRTESIELTVVLTPQVSIPHRYGKNAKLFDDVLEQELFPFLIGTVRTITDNNFCIWQAMFPFLIGTVRTHVQLFGWMDEKGFHSS